jgi:hypothetical protein
MIKEVRLLYAPFKYFVSGHVCLIFQLVDGKEIVISPEAQTEKFIPILGFLPFYKLRYLKLEYPEYIKKYQRTSRSFHSAILEIESKSASSLYKEMNDRVSYLEANKEIYHILLNSCITNTIKHLKQSAKLNLTISQRVKLHFKPYLLADIVKNKGID